MLKSRLKNCFLRAKPYLSVVRANNQIGTYLLFFPCAWSTAFGASNGCFPDLKILTLFLSGSFVMRNAGCIVNDLIDVDLDAKVDRTKNRPLSSGLLTKSKAIYFLISQLLIGLMVLAQFNTKTFILGFGSVPLFLVYPYMKRLTYWPQIFLGFAFNYGALMGIMAVTGQFQASTAFPLYVAGIFHTLIYDTIYAFQDIKDDKKIGVKSLAIFIEKNPKKWLSSFSVLMAMFLSVSGYSAEMGFLFYSISVVGSLGHLCWQINTLNTQKPEKCKELFISNKWTSSIIFAGIALDKLLK